MEMVWIMHKLMNIVNRMRNISSCHGDIDEASDKCPIKRQIRNVIALIVVIYDFELKRGVNSLGIS